jgi:hypothetical protein
MRATVNGLDVAFTDEGGGAPLLLVPFEQPEAFNGLLRGFLASLPAGGAP